MPKVKPLILPKKRKPPVKPDHLIELIQRYKKDRRMTWEEIAPEVGMSLDGVCGKIHKGNRTFTVSDLRKFAEALDIPPEEIGEAIAADLAG